MVMTMYTLFHNIPQPTADQMERALEGNIVQLRGGVFRISICHSV
jgi:xanthine dehydrogenase iron-sulfur cluster and FAD-binding subunit A